MQPVGPFGTNQFQNVQTVHTVQPVGPFGTNQFQNVQTVHLQLLKNAKKRAGGNK